LDYDIDSELIRRDFPVSRRNIYMNNGAIAPTPLSTVKAITDFLLKCSEDGPSSERMSQFIESLMKETRIRISHLINCETEEIVFTQSTTEGINYVANGVQLNKNDSIIVRDGTQEHSANYLPWLQLSRRKSVKIDELRIDENGFFDVAELEKMSKKKNTRLVVLSHALYNNGAIMPVDKVGKIAKENNILYCIDAAQTVGSINVDVKKIGCDFMAFPAFKWICGPLGVGVFYCNKKAVHSLSPQFIGAESAILTEQKKISLHESPKRFQAGFRNYPGIAGLESSLRYILRLGIMNIRKKNTKIANLLRDELAKIPSVIIYGPESDNLRTSIISFSSTKLNSEDIVTKLQQNQTILAKRSMGNRGDVVRASPHFFNNEEDVIRVGNFLKSLLR
jgi:cysteine desulfurase/selenocysteine lyase